MPKTQMEAATFDDALSALDKLEQGAHSGVRLSKRDCASLLVLIHKMLDFGGEKK